ncbi:hypothetical protein C823_000953 [Eubacterium plexicaudatum ASF492]|uniref:Uncharacterized protein n=1 Tax=Eubacterium plexicaudatum ASF492 TaxID=1235802 RepID=N1ZTT2_9FIRM|nr:hypothetical protein C823_000953 [Eubacterium plexicaudatum ASF492]
MTKQLNILHAEDDQNVFESCRNSILRTFDRAVLPEPRLIMFPILAVYFRKSYNFRKKIKYMMCYCWI